MPQAIAVAASAVSKLAAGLAFTAFGTTGTGYVIGATIQTMVFHGTQALIYAGLPVALPASEPSQ